MSGLNLIKINQRVGEPQFLDPALTKSGFLSGADSSQVHTQQGADAALAAKAVRKNRSADHG